MTKSEYRKARRLVRDNGWYALNWLTGSVLQAFQRLRWQHIDDLADKADFLSYMRGVK